MNALYASSENRLNKVPPLEPLLEAEAELEDLENQLLDDVSAAEG